MRRLFFLCFCFTVLFGVNLFANTGTLDTANFGSPNGYITESFTFTSYDIPKIEAMLVKDDGKIVVVGEQDSGGTPSPAFIAQFNADGSLDTSFNSSGMNLFQVTQNWQGSHGNNEVTTAKALALVSDGILVVGRYTNVSPGGTYIIKFNFDGSFANFGTTTCNGSTTPNCSTLVGSNYAFVGLGVTSENEILVAGNDSSDPSFFVSQYDSSGNFDTSFGDGGFVTSPASHTANAAVMQSDDKILIGGYASVNGMLARVSAEGSFDNSFGDAGIATYQISDTTLINALTLGTNGSIAATGVALSYTDYYGDLFAMKVDSSGNYDPNFNGNGFAFNDQDLGSTGNGVALQSDGSVLVGAVWADENYDNYMALLRYLPNGSLDSNFGSDGIAFAFSDYGASTALVYHDGKADLAGFGTPQGSMMTDVIAQFLAAENQADLSIVKTSEASTASVGDQVAYTLTILNSGPQEAFYIVVSDPLPDGLGLVVGSLESSDGTCSLEGSTIACSLFFLANGDSFTITYQASVSSSGTLTNTALVAAATDDPDPSNNSSSASITVSGGSSGAPNLQVSIDCPSSNISVGAEVTCETTIENSGDGDSTDTTIAFIASDNWQFVSSSLLDSSMRSGFLRKNLSTLSCSGDPESCSLGTITAGSSVTLGVLMQVTGEGDLTLSATVSGNGGSASASGSTTINSSTLTGTGCALNAAITGSASMIWIYSLMIILPTVRRRAKK